MTEENVTLFTYHFNFEDGTSKKFELRLNNEKYEVVRQEKTPLPEWTKLDENKCANCPLQSEQVSHCPVAVNLSDLVAFFTDHFSFEKVEIRVETANREYLKKTDIQDGVQSIYGLIMATSGCPHMNFFKPMAQFHLPFSQFEETLARTISIYLLRQHFLLEQGRITEVNLKTLGQCYTEVNLVNRGIAARFSQIKMKDSSKNGVAILDALATLVPMELTDGYKNFENLFDRQDSYKK